MSAAELQEQQERLTALVNVLGFASLDHLEDFVILHGAARVVPASSIAAAGASLPLDETQTQGNAGTSYSETKHAQRNEERRKENKRLKSEVEEVRKEVAWLRREHEKHVETIDRLGKDKTRLLDLIDELTAKVEAAKGGGGGGGADPDELASLAEEASALYDRIDELEEIVVELEDRIGAMEEGSRLAEEERTSLVEENRGKSEAYDEMVAFNVQAETELEETWLDKMKLQEELDDLKSKIGALSAIVTRPTSASASRSTPRSGPAYTPRPTRQLPRSGLANSATPVTLPRGPTQLRGPVPPSTSRTSAQATPATNAVSSPILPSNPAVQSSSSSSSSSPPVAAVTATTSSSIVPPLPKANTSAFIVSEPSHSSTKIQTSLSSETSTASPSPVSISAPNPSIIKPTAPPLAPSSGDKLNPASSTSVSASNPAAPSSSSRITSVQARQLKQYPHALSSYKSVIEGISSQQAWVVKIKPNLTPSLLSSLPPHPPLSTYPSPEFPSFVTLPVIAADPSLSRPAWIVDGTLQRKYEGLEDAEKRAVQRSAQWRNWIKLAKVKIQEEVVSQQKASRVETSMKGKGKGKEKEENTETPKGTKVLVKKKRRISKEGQEGTPTSSTSAATSTSTSRPLRSSLAPSTSKIPSSSASSTTAFQPRTSSPFLDENITAIKSDRPPPASVTGDTQLPPSPEERHSTNVPDAGPSTTKKRKWNLLSPSKKTKATPEFVSRQELLKSPLKASPVKRRGPSILVDDTQPIVTTRQNSHPSSDAAASEYGAEPDTLRSTTEEGEPDTIRSSEADTAPPRRLLSRSVSRSQSRSPQKKGSQLLQNLSPVKMSPLHRTAAVSHDSSGSRPKPPFSPAYAARMQQEANAAVSLSPQPSPRRIPLRPSPNRHSQPSRSPSSSPAKRDLSMPPSAQPARVARQIASPATRQVTRVTAQDAADAVRGLLFSKATSASPNKRRKGKGKAVQRENENEIEIKEEETDGDPFNDSRQGGDRYSRQQSSRSVSPSPRKSKRKSGDGQGEGDDSARSPKRSKRITKQTATQTRADEENDVKPVLRGQTESIGEMPMGSDQEEARKLWVRKIQAARHERVIKTKKEKEKQSGSPRVQLELNPDRNQGQTHAFKQTERNKAIRQTMVAEACGNCKAYYDRKKQPVPIGHCHHIDARKEAAPQTGGGGWLDARAADVEKRMQQDGRHRAAQRTVPEPPDYWQMGFPSTQQAEKINARAKQQKAVQEEYKKAEADQANGVYRYRNEINRS